MWENLQLEPKSHWPATGGQLLTAGTGFPAEGQPEAGRAGAGD